MDKAQFLKTDWHKTLAKYGRPDNLKAAWQLCNTFIPYFALWALMVVMIRSGISYWLVLPLIAVASGMLIRIFIFFHDCCHGSFFSSRGANRFLGYVTGILTFTPFEDWGRTHAGHHASSGDLDRRGTGDVWTMTVGEYLAASKVQKLTYRLFRNPLVLFGVSPLFLFLVLQRFPHKGVGKRERMSVHRTNLAILAVIGLACLTMGWRTYLLIQIPIAIVAFGAGVWLFYVQHQFEEDYWARHESWDPIRAALEGSSYYKLPKVLQWFTGNIGLHHVHHLRSGIPNYKLQECLNNIPALQVVEPLTIRKSLKSLFLHLWDETNDKLVSFRALRIARD